MVSTLPLSHVTVTFAVITLIVPCKMQKLQTFRADTKDCKCIWALYHFYAYRGGESWWASNCKDFSTILIGNLHYSTGSLREASSERHFTWNANPYNFSAQNISLGRIQTSLQSVSACISACKELEFERIPLHGSVLQDLTVIISAISEKYQL